MKAKANQKRERKGLREITANPWIPVIKAIKRRAKEKTLYDYVYTLWKKTKRQQKVRRRKDRSGTKSSKRVRFRTDEKASGEKRQQRQKQHRRMCKLIRKLEPEGEPGDSTGESTTGSEAEEEGKRQLFAAKRLDLNTLDQSQLGTTVYLKEGTDLTAEQLANHVAMIPEMTKSAKKSRLGNRRHWRRWS